MVNIYVLKIKILFLTYIYGILNINTRLATYILLCIIITIIISWGIRQHKLKTVVYNRVKFYLKINFFL